jgi:geranylgeranyl pyrophosphate synthase
MGALLGNAAEDVVASVGSYAFNLGLAFQIVDDVLDIIGDPETLGKPVGSDIVQGAGAIMAQNGRQITSDGASPSQQPEEAADPIVEMMARLRDSGAVDVALVKANDYAARARDALKTLPESPARLELESLVDLVVNRER